MKKVYKNACKSYTAQVTNLGFNIQNRHWVALCAPTKALECPLKWNHINHSIEHRLSDMHFVLIMSGAKVQLSNWETIHRITLPCIKYCSCTNRKMRDILNGNLEFSASMNSTVVLTNVAWHCSPGFIYVSYRRTVHVLSFAIISLNMRILKIS